MQTKKRKDPIVGTVDEMDKARIIIHPPAKRTKKVYPSEYVKVPGTIITDSDSIDIGREIGKGTFSRCYLAQSIETKAVFAIKAQRFKPCSSSTAARIEREILIHEHASRHRAVTKYMGSYQDEHNLYIQLELCSNGDMNSYIKSHGPLSIEKSWKIMQSISSGIEFLHSGRILHRDIKLANIFLTANLEPKLGDFGLAYRLSPGETRKFSRAGTPAYMAPELSLAPHICSTASDIWALGIMWFATVYSFLPFNAPSTEETCKLVAKGYFKIPESPQSPPEFRKLITMLLSFNSAVRPTASQLVSLLKIDPFKSPMVPARAVQRAAGGAVKLAGKCQMLPSHRHAITRLELKLPSIMSPVKPQIGSTKVGRDWENHFKTSPICQSKRGPTLAPGVVFPKSPRDARPLMVPNRI